MDTSNSTTDRDGFKPSGTPLEVYLKQLYGDLHGVIPRLANEGSLNQVATDLSSDHYNVSSSWVRNWLVRNGYKRINRWERQAVKS